IGPMVEQVLRRLEVVLAHGEVERCAVRVMAAGQARVPGQEVDDGLQVAHGGGAEEFPDIGSGARGPLQAATALELVGLDHARPAPCASSSASTSAQPDG